MDNYSFQVQWSEPDKSYVAGCPEFPGVTALAPTPEEALAELRIALDATVATYRHEWWELPAPRHSVQHSGQFRLRVPHSLHSALAERAAEEGVSLNTLAITYLANSIGAAAAQSRAVQQCERALQDMKNLTGAFARGWNEEQPRFVPMSEWEPLEFSQRIPHGRTPAEASGHGAFTIGGEMARKPARRQSVRIPLSKVLAA